MTMEVPSSSSVPTSSGTIIDQTAGVEQAEELKKRANELFVAKNYAEADLLYSEALLLASTDISMQVLLYTNRAASRIGLLRYEEAISDADAAIALDPQWVKAYYRKASALAAQNCVREVYETWLGAATVCEHDAALVKQFKNAQDKWLKIFRSPSQPVVSLEDLLRRYQLFSDKRERLSSLAHFWNDSDKEERLSYLLLLLQIIGGAGGISDATLELLVPEMMIDMPLQNYEDLPRERLQQWFDFFKNLPSDQKKLAFRAIWDHLSLEEKNDIIVDMKELFGPKDADEENDGENSEEQ